MRNTPWRRVLFGLCWLMLSLSAWAQSSAPVNPPMGINLSGGEFGQKFPGVYNTDYTYATAYDLDYLQEHGFRLVRVPFKWERLQRELGGPLHQPDLDRLLALTREAAKRDILVVIEPHNYGRRSMAEGEAAIRIGEGGLTKEQFAEFWARMAEAFKNEPNLAGYDLVNEPYAMLTECPWFDIAQACIDSIRAVDPQTPIWVGGDDWSSAARWRAKSDNLKNLKDPADNLIFEAHVYFDHDHSGRYRKSYDEDGAYPEVGVDRARPFVEWLQKNNLRGYFGEYGIPKEDPRWREVMVNFLDYANANGLNAAYWSSGPWWPVETTRMPINTTKRPYMPQLEIISGYNE